MATIDATSSYDEVRAEVIDSMLFIKDHDAAKAGRFLYAFGVYLTIIAAKQKSGGLEEIELPLDQLEAYAVKAQRIHDALRTGARRVVQLDMRGFNG